MIFWRRVSGLTLFVIVAFWGATFELVQRATTDYPVLGFLAWRFFIATLAMLVTVHWIPRDTRALIAGGLIGLVLAVAYLFQTFSLQMTDSTQTGMITGLFIIFVPVFGWILFGVRVTARIWLGLAVSLMGLYLLVQPGNEGWNYGSLLALLCAASFGLQVALIDRVAGQMHVLSLTLGQLAAATIVFWTGWFVTDLARGVSSSWIPASHVWPALVATGLIGSALGFAAQTFSQRYLSATEAGIIIMTEPVFAAVVGWIYGERLEPVQWFGAAVMLGTTVWLGLVSSRPDPESTIPADIVASAISE